VWVVPGDWKLANVSPIYKGKGGSDNVANYKPISVTNCFIKILENIIFKHPPNYLLRYNILSDDQSGFTNDWKTALKNLGRRLSGPAGLEIFKI
jgi:hypothetical protein